LPGCHCVFGGGRFLAAPFDQPLRSPAAEATPFVCAVAAAPTVDVDDAEEFEFIEDAEFVRGMVFRCGSKMLPLTSSALIALPPHAGRLMFEKEGGGATAVIGNMF
jgi:hypothetical protein